MGVLGFYEWGRDPRIQLEYSNDGGVTYELASRKLGRSTGKVELNAPLATRWADWQLTLDRVVPHAQDWMDFTPAKSAAPTPELPDGVRVRVQQGAEISEQWIPAGWQVSVPASTSEVQIAYGWKQIGLPIALELVDFEV